MESTPQLWLNHLQDKQAQTGTPKSSTFNVECEKILYLLKCLCMTFWTKQVWLALLITCCWTKHWRCWLQNFIQDKPTWCLECGVTVIWMHHGVASGTPFGGWTPILERYSLIWCLDDWAVYCRLSHEYKVSCVSYCGSRRVIFCWAWTHVVDA